MTYTYFDDTEVDKGVNSVQHLRSVTRSDRGQALKESNLAQGWTYDHTKDEISINLAHKNGSDRHALIFLPPSSEWTDESPKQISDSAGWRAVSECVDDHKTCKLYFLFQFAGTLLRKVHIEIGRAHV